VKNQYFGDLNDYLKYGMLRAFGRQMSIAVIWMMTPDDGSNDGRKLEYLDRYGRRSHDPELFDFLREWRRNDGRRDISLIEESGLLPNCRFFREIVPDDVAGRAQWLERAREFARGSDLVFFDPDNGLPVKSTRPGAKGWSKYVGLEEVHAFYDDGHSILIYQHTDRTPRRNLIRSKLSQLYERFECERFTSFLARNWVGLLVSNAMHTLPLSHARRQILLDWDTAICVQDNVVIPVPVSPREILERPKRHFARQMQSITTEIGYVNRNKQAVMRKTDMPGTDHGQKVYVMRCDPCGAEYGTNGSTIYLAKCPRCQRGAKGLAFE
jgi:hypothetical protein